MVRKSTQSVSNKGCGIYFLICNGSVSYIGKTTDLVNRLMQHKLQLMDYDSFRFIECCEDKLDLYEIRWINRFKPEHNHTNKGRKKQKIYYKKKERIYKASVKYYMSPKNSKTMTFRKLSSKSIIGFGAWKDKTVGSMIKAGKVIELIDMYYKLSHISFLDEVLNELKITPEFQIIKPGKDHDKGYEFKHLIYPELCEIRHEKYMNGVSRIARNNAKSSIARDSRANLTSKNHGH
jgi:hypothetical protein